MRNKMKKTKSYHHGNLAESLLNAVDEIATQFGLEAVTLRACAKLVGVSPSSAFRHYADKRALFTAFATRALLELSAAMSNAKEQALQKDENAFKAVGLAYIEFAIDKPAFFRAMWREESIYSNDDAYQNAANTLSQHLTAGFADTLNDQDPNNFSAQELLAWSAVHGLASLLIDGPVCNGDSKVSMMQKADEMLLSLAPSFSESAG